MDIDISPRMIVSDMVAIHRMVLDGAGVSLVPSYLAAPDLAAGRLIEMLPGVGLPKLDVYAAFSRDRASLRKVAVLLEELARIPDLI